MYFNDLYANFRVKIDDFGDVQHFSSTSYGTVQFFHIWGHSYLKHILSKLIIFTALQLISGFEILLHQNGSNMVHSLYRNRLNRKKMRSHAISI